ncbi:MAG: flp pilus-assembly TadE/G-like family protein [Pseudonocardiales bacterium]|nr:flp pilus-assembly TadE/G-like family protein [Pseudonocardiales bacterium]MBV9030140.1 flp pilus-assembly TadE/G-like family protein [Pseudonocardiales bacterium]MBW0010707.1 flp pilus-assembly TadE/G-like family protein [Pseudonocardiales bacterium]
MATVWAAGAIAVLVSMAVFGLRLGEAVVVRHQVESAADLAALAGAGQVLAGEQYTCTQARRVTDRMRVQLVSCRTLGWDVLVDVTAQPGGWLSGLGAATGRARAGPAATPGDFSPDGFREQQAPGRSSYDTKEPFGEFSALAVVEQIRQDDGRSEGSFLAGGALDASATLGYIGASTGRLG